MSEEDKIGTSESFEGLKISKRENEIGNFAEPEESFSFIHMQRILTERLDRGNVGRRSLLQQRFVTCVIGMILLCNVYALSTLVCFSQTDLDYTYSDIEAVNSSCPGPPVNLTSEELTLLTEGTLYWVKNHSIIVNSYFIGYSLTQIPGGLIAERIGGKHVVAISLLFSSLLTVTTPAIVKKFHEDGAIVTRFLLGCFIGPMIPALCVVVAHWAPPDERGRIITIVFCGEQLGIIYSTIVSFTVTNAVEFGCEYIYYLFGIVGLFWFVVCAVIIYNDPAVNPFISPYEKQFLKDHLRRFVKRNKYLPSTPIFEILGCVPVWGLVFAHISYAVLFNQYEFFLPIYLRNYQKISQYSSHLFHYITSVAIIIVAVLSGWLADILLLNDALSIEKLRKSYAATASFGSVIFLVIGVIIKCNKYAVSVLFIVAVTLMGFFHSSIRINAFDLSPNYVGTITGLAHVFSSLIDFISLKLVKYFISQHGYLEWQVSFMILYLILFFSSVIFVLFGKADLQPLNYPDI